MPKDAPVDAGALAEPIVGPHRRVSEMQAKLHRWAAADPGRRFDDLFNFVCDPATLLVAFERVAGNHGANTPGVDGLTAAHVEEVVGLSGFLDDLRTCLEGWFVSAVAGAGTQDSQARRVGQAAKARHSHGGGIVTGRAVTNWVSSLSRIHSIR
jgi:hypothetical protein